MGRPRSKGLTVPPTSELILEHAAVVFADVGYERAKLEDIAQRLHISRPALLYHFASKDQLYVRVVERALAELADALRDVSTLDLVVARFVSFVDARPTIARIVAREMLSDDGPGRALLVDVGAPLLDQVVRALADAAPSHGDRKRVRAVLMLFISNALLRVAANHDVARALWHTPASADVLASFAHTLLR